MSYSFDGSNDHLDSGGQVIANLPLTLAAWFKKGTGTAQSIMTNGTSGSANNRFALSTSTGDALTAITVNNAGSSGSSTTTNTFMASTWSHAAGVFASTTSRTAYLNGQAATPQTTSIAPNDTNLVRVGESTTGTADFNGEIAEVGMWNVALDASEIASLAAGVSPLLIRPESLVAYWPLYGNNNPTVDYVGGFGLTPTGATKGTTHPRVYFPSRQRLTSTPIAQTATATVAATATQQSGSVTGKLTHTGTVACTATAATGSATGQLTKSGTVACTSTAQSGSVTGKLIYQAVVTCLATQASGSATGKLTLKGIVDAACAAATASVTGTVAQPAIASGDIDFSIPSNRVDFTIPHRNV